MSIFIGLPDKPGVDLSGAFTLTVNQERYVREQPVVGLAGGITEDLGASNDEFFIRGYLASGADDERKILLGMEGTIQGMIMRSVSDQFRWDDPLIRIKSVMFEERGGDDTPFYPFTIRATRTSSGQLWQVSGVAGVFAKEDRVYAGLSQFNSVGITEEVRGGISQFAIVEEP